MRKEAHGSREREREQERNRGVSTYNQEERESKGSNRFFSLLLNRLSIFFFLIPLSLGAAQIHRLQFFLPS